jgi:hypothetical protein
VIGGALPIALATRSWRADNGNTTVAEVTAAERGASHRHRLMLSLPQNQGRTGRCLRRRTPSITSAAPDVTYASDRASARSIPNAWSSSALLQCPRSP